MFRKKQPLMGATTIMSTSVLPSAAVSSAISIIHWNLHIHVIHHPLLAHIFLSEQIFPKVLESQKYY